MTIAIHIPSVLRDTSGGAAELEVEAGTIKAVLAQLEQEYPALYRSICDETGSVRPHVNLFINTTLVLIHDHGLETRLKPGDVVSIFQAVSGG